LALWRTRRRLGGVIRCFWRNNAIGDTDGAGGRIVESH
jgi:hypothetical protein